MITNHFYVFKTWPNPLFYNSSENGVKFDKQKFKDTFIELEEENLFLMNQIQEKEFQLEEIKKNLDEKMNIK